VRFASLAWNPTVAITLRPVDDDDLDDLFRWVNDPTAVAMAAVTRAHPADRPALDAHCERVRSDPATINQAIGEDGVLAGAIASFTVEGERELTYWIDRARWGAGSRRRRWGCSSAAMSFPARSGP
jgi:RimJ/RimL family protein N-acetyltransferase